MLHKVQFRYKKYTTTITGWTKDLATGTTTKDRTRNLHRYKIEISVKNRFVLMDSDDERRPMRHWETLMNSSMTEAVRLGRYWVVRGQLYRTDEDLKAEEAWALAIQIDRNKERKLKRAMAELKMDEGKIERREPIPDDVKIFVWQRDSGKCVKCGSTKNLEFDHVIPRAKGGGNTARNIQILCEECNRVKGPSLI